MNTTIPPGLTSIIVPCFNQLAFTEACLQGLFRHTRHAWELIAVNNGSTDGTGDYLNGIRDASAVPVTVIKNAQNRGFPAAINQGLQQAQGEYLVLLNNDAVVTDGWLDQLIALTQIRPNPQRDRETFGPAEGGVGRPAPNAGGVGRPAPNAGSPAPHAGSPAPNANLPTAHSPLSTQRIGLVGPMSNYATPPQLVENVPYRDLDEMHEFARRWRDEHRGKWFTAPKLSGFCVLMKRDVYETIGGLDERFGLGLFDDDDLAERARRAGFELAVAHDLFVHHFGSRTFAGNGIDAEGLLNENARRFAAKWGRDMPQGWKVALRTWSGLPDFFAESQREFARQVDEQRTGVAAVPPSRLCEKRSRTVRVSLTMIVRDEQDNLAHALESVRGIFDEILVVDTGSVDSTKEIAREFGARVYDFAWIDDFAAARNEALSHATGDYAFWLDADDVVNPSEREKLRSLLDGLVGAPE